MKGIAAVYPYTAAGRGLAETRSINHIIFCLRGCLRAGGFDADWTDIGSSHGCNEQEGGEFSKDWKREQVVFPRLGKFDSEIFQGLEKR
ncbi:MAG: hypothetical protein NTY53_22065, partial [Kiritimatiellaeota bacterium]|nr:hypothetical protein [Kiritimatiellota bacterium]